mmetsp:Transcript_55644/g.120182  ORF Transcript_55644/g.120182 Transcript_55644/m.120182 type:complete len:208 (-) Transcript_55644:946-1569(-)
MPPCRRLWRVRRTPWRGLLRPRSPYKIGPQSWCRSQPRQAARAASITWPLKQMLQLQLRWNQLRWNQPACLRRTSPSKMRRSGRQSRRDLLTVLQRRPLPTTAVTLDGNTWQRKSPSMSERSRGRTSQGESLAARSLGRSPHRKQSSQGRTSLGKTRFQGTQLCPQCSHQCSHQCRGMASMAAAARLQTPKKPRKRSWPCGGTSRRF